MSCLSQSRASVSPRPLHPLLLHQLPSRPLSLHTSINSHQFQAQHTYIHIHCTSSTHVHTTSLSPSPSLSLSHSLTKPGPLTRQNAKSTVSCGITVQLLAPQARVQRLGCFVCFPPLNHVISYQLWPSRSVSNGPRCVAQCRAEQSSSFKLGSVRCMERPLNRDTQHIFTIPLTFIVCCCNAVHHTSSLFGEAFDISRCGEELELGYFMFIE